METKSFLKFLKFDSTNHIKKILKEKAFLAFYEKGIPDYHANFFPGVYYKAL